MKTVYIPKGKTASYDSLEAERLVVNGCLKVARDLKAGTIIGSGVILAGTISADDIRVRKLEAASVYCLRLSAKWVQADEVIASEEAVVSCHLRTDYAASARLTVGLHEVGLIEAIEVINLPPKKVHPFWMLLATVLWPIQAVLAVVHSVFCTGEVMDAEYQQAPNDTARPAA